MKPSTDRTTRLAERAAAEAAAGAAHRETVARCKAEVQASLAAHDSALLDLAATHDAFVGELEEKLAKDTIDTLTPLIVALPTNTREVSDQIGKAWRALNDRSVAELGEPLSWIHLGLAMAAPHGFAVHLAHSDAWTFAAPATHVHAASTAARVISEGEALPVVDLALRTLESEVCQAGAQWRDRADPDRLQALLSRATHSAMHSAAADLDHDRHVAANEARRHDPAAREATRAWHAYQRRLQDGGPSGPVPAIDPGFDHFRKIAAG